MYLLNQKEPLKIWLLLRNQIFMILISLIFVGFTTFFTECKKSVLFSWLCCGSWAGVALLPQPRLPHSGIYDDSSCWPASHRDLEKGEGDVPRLDKQSQRRWGWRWRWQWRSGAWRGTQSNPSMNYISAQLGNTAACLQDICPVGELNVK